MNKLTVYSFLGVITIFASTVNAEVVVEPLPASVVSVSPAQGVVNLSKNANPLGVQEIAVAFNQVPEVNPEAVGEMAIYVDGNTEPVETLPASAAYVDNMGQPVGGFIFKGKFVDPGVYTVTVPEGVWRFASDNSGSAYTYSPALTLNYEILLTQSLTPAPGVCPSISEFTLTFFNNPAIEEVAGVVCEVMAQKNYDSYPLAVKNIENDVDTPDGKVAKVTLAVTGAGEAGVLTTPDTYILNLGQGKFNLTYSDGSSRLSDEVRDFYTISAIGAPAIDPAPGNVESFLSFTITPQAGEFAFWFSDNMAKSYIYPVGDDGTHSSTPLYTLKCTGGEFGRNIIISILDDKGKAIKEPVVPESGRYVLELAPGLYSGQLTSADEMVNSPAFTFEYAIAGQHTGIEEADVSGVSASYEVYTFTGICVGHDLDINTVRALPAGMYIINGKKTAVR